MDVLILIQDADVVLTGLVDFILDCIGTIVMITDPHTCLMPTMAIGDSATVLHTAAASFSWRGLCDVDLQLLAMVEVGECTVQ